MNCREMFNRIAASSRTDPHLGVLFGKAQEYALVYIFAKERQKGCDGLGEMTNLKDEFRGVLDELIDYCKEKGYLVGADSYEMDLMSEAIGKTSHV